MNRLISILCLFVAFASLSSAFYDSGSKVIKLTSANFREKVVQGNELWFVEFYAPWCGHCQRLTPEWDKLATALDGIIKIGAVDMTTDAEAGAPYGIQGFPTLKFFGADKSKPIDHQGQRSADDMVNFALDHAKRAAEAKLRGNTGSSSSSSYYSSSSESHDGGSREGQADQDVIVLTEDNFDDLMNSEDLWIVDFYAAWCGHCKNLEPEWNRAATELKGEVKVAKVDCMAQPGLAEKFGVRQYPMIKLFPSGPKSESAVEGYEGSHSSSSIVSWALEKKAQYKPPLKVLQLVNQQVFDDYCTNLRGVCFITFLPHIYDSSAEERNTYIEIFQELARVNRLNPVSFLWSQGGDYYEFEEKLGLGSGYPSLVAISINKMVYAPLTGSFSQKNIDQFVRGLVSGKQALFKLREVPKFKKVAEWDGKDQKPAEYEPVDL